MGILEGITNIFTPADTSAAEINASPMPPVAKEVVRQDNPEKASSIKAVASAMQDDVKQGNEKRARFELLMKMLLEQKVKEDEQD